MGVITEPEYETVEKEVEKYQCDKCDYVSENSDEFVTSFRNDGVTDTLSPIGKPDRFLYCTKCDGSNAVAKKEARHEKRQYQINKVHESVVVGTSIVSYIVGSVLQSAYVALNIADGWAEVIGGFILLLLGWAVGFIAVTAMLFVVTTIGIKLGVLKR